MTTITKRDLVIELSNRTGQTQSHVFDIFQAALDYMIEELAKGHEITLRRFGTFEVRIAEAKIGRNPNKPGTEMEIPARAVVKFKPGKEVKALVAAALPKIQRSNRQAARPQAPKGAKANSGEPSAAPRRIRPL